MLPYPKKVDVEIVQKRFKEGMTTKEIANELGVTRQSIWRAMKARPLPEPLDLVVRIGKLVKDLEHQIPITQRSNRSKEARLMGEAKDLLIYLRDYKV